jgi:hypothetical protein
LAAHAQLHHREVVVDANGIATIRVTLEHIRDVESGLVLATLSPPFNAVYFASKAALLPGARRVTVDQRKTRRGVWIASISPEALQEAGISGELASLHWWFNASNAYPFTQRDLLVPDCSFYESGQADHAGRSCVLRIASDELRLSLRFNSKEAVRRRDSTARVERPKARWHGIGHDWTSEPPSQMNFDDADNRLSVSFLEPVVGHRYAITFAPATDANAELARQWTAATDVTRQLVAVRKNRDLKAETLRSTWTEGLRQELESQYGEPVSADREWTSAGFLWDPDAQKLSAAYGWFPPDHWGHAFDYGEGVAGHAFRFGREASYQQGNPSLIYQPRDEKDYEWIVCLPLNYKDSCIGVVSFAGHRRPTDKVGHHLFLLAAAKTPIRTELRIDFSVLTFRVNSAFWEAILKHHADSKLGEEALACLEELDRRRPIGASSPPGLLTAVSQRLAASRSATEPAAAAGTEDAAAMTSAESSAAAPIARSEPAMTSAQVQPLPPSAFSDSLKPHERDARLITGRPPRKKWTLKHVSAVAAILTAIAACVAAIAEWRSSGSAPDAARPAAAAAPQPATETTDGAKGSNQRETVLDLRLTLDLLHGRKGGLERLRSELEEGKTLPSLSKQDLGGANLERAPLSRVDLFGGNLRDADLSGANLDGANLQDAVLYAAELKGAVLDNADLSRAVLVGANLPGATIAGALLTDADLTGANLVRVKGWNRLQLTAACGDRTTRLPQGAPPMRGCRRAVLPSPP